MRTSNVRARTLRRMLLAAAAAALLLSVPATALAGGGTVVKGTAFLEGKDPARMTLILEDDIVVHVSDETRIYNGDHRRISFATIQVPKKNELVSVDYSGTRAGKGPIEADRLVVQPQPR